MSAYYTYEEDMIEWEDEEKFNMYRNLGISAQDMHGMINKENDPIDIRDLSPYTYPNLKDLKAINYYSVCLGSFIKWDYKKNTKIIMDKLGWKGDLLEGVPQDINKEYAKIECWMQGTRDYIKFLKRGYGRITQILNFEIRNNNISTQKAQNLIDKYEGRKPQSLKYFLEYMGITEDEFNNKIKEFIVPPHNPNFELPLAEKLPDMDEWYKEDNL